MKAEDIRDMFRDSKKDNKKAIEQRDAWRHEARRHLSETNQADLYEMFLAAKKGNEEGLINLFAAATFLLNERIYQHEKYSNSAIKHRRVKRQIILQLSIDIYRELFLETNDIDPEIYNQTKRV